MGIMHDKLDGHFQKGLETVVNIFHQREEKSFWNVGAF